MIRNLRIASLTDHTLENEHFVAQFTHLDTLVFNHVRMPKLIEQQILVPSNAQIAASLPDSAEDRNCSIRMNPIENIAECLVTCD